MPKSVPSLEPEGVTPEDQLTKLEQLLEQQKIADREIAQIREGLEKANANKVAKLRAEIIKLDKQITDLTAERKNLSAEHFKLTGIRFRSESKGE